MTPQERAEFDDLREMVDVLMTEVFGDPETLTAEQPPSFLGLGEARKRLFEKAKERK